MNMGRSARHTVCLEGWACVVQQGGVLGVGNAPRGVQDAQVAAGAGAEVVRLQGVRHDVAARVAGSALRQLRKGRYTQVLRSNGRFLKGSLEFDWR